MVSFLTTSIIGYGLFSYEKAAIRYLKEEERVKGYSQVLLQLGTNYLYLNNSSLLKGILLTRSFQVLTALSGTAFITFLTVNFFNIDTCHLSYQSKIDEGVKLVARGVKWTLIAHATMEILFRRNLLGFALLLPLAFNKITSFKTLNNSLSAIGWWVALPYWVGLPGAVVKSSMIAHKALEGLSWKFSNYLRIGMSQEEQYTEHLTRCDEAGKLKIVALCESYQKKHPESDRVKNIKSEMTINYTLPAQFAVLDELETINRSAIHLPHYFSLLPNRRNRLLTLVTEHSNFDNLRSALLFSDDLESTPDLKTLRDLIRPLTFVFTGNLSDNPDPKSSFIPNLKEVVRDGNSPTLSRKGYLFTRRFSTSPLPQN